MEYRWFFFKYNNNLMTKDIFIFYLTLIFFPFQEKPAEERIMVSLTINTKKQRKKTYNT
jgi:hypothetical protein